MFDKSGGKGDKQDAVNGAAMTAMKLLVKSKLGGSPVVGGSNSGGLSGLLSLVSDSSLVPCQYSGTTNQVAK